MEEMHRAGRGERALSFHALSGTPLSQHLHVFSNPEVPRLVNVFLPLSCKLPQEKGL